ncbi:MAG: hypothetical protein JW940_08260 [Polyangiaceae bacterium]|nr:hypothetical protein [Polyangiaceae bacterium]
MTQHASVRVALCAAALVFAACPRDKNDDPLTLAEASQALEETTLESQAQALASDSIELSTHFTIGQAARDAAAELREFILAELPCAQLTLEDATLTVDYGVEGDACLYHGKRITGQSRVSVAKNDRDDVVVEHSWTDLSNGIVEVDGHATVTYTLDDPSRHVVHDVTITRLRDGLELESQGDRTQRPLEGGLVEGFQVDGTRAWSSRRGDWGLVIDDVEMRWVDPVPQAGTYKLVTPKNKELKLGFERKDEDTITVTLAGPKRQFVFDVSKTGTATRVDE